MTFFPLPDEFYADPLFLGQSDAAVALYARAGSWSAHHLTDGLVPSTALPLLTTATEAPAQLCEVGVWKRTRGGFQFVDWPREASRAYVEAKREAWRRRQANRRSSDDAMSRRDSRVSHAGVTRDSRRESPLSNSSSIQEKEQETPTSSLARKKATRIPADFAVTDAMVTWARANTPNVGQVETDTFIDYWTAAAGPTATKKDWVAAWRNWMRKAQKDTRARAPTNGHRNQTDANIAALLGVTTDQQPRPRALPGGAT